MPEKFAFKGALVGGAAIDSDKRSSATIRALVNIFGGKAFAYAALASEQYVCV